jgi:hypothetical protein
MAVTNKPFFSKALYQDVQTLVNSDGQTVLALTTTQTDGVRITSIIATSNDTSARDITLYLSISGNHYPLITVQVPVSSGYSNSIPPTDVLKGGITPGSFPGLAYDANGNPYIDLPSGSTLSVNAPVTVSSTKTINVIATGEAF